MKKALNIIDNCIKGISIAIGIIGVMILAASIIYATQTNNSGTAIVYLLSAYIVIAFVVAIFAALSDNTKFHFKDVSFYSFYSFCIFYPIIIDIISAFLCIKLNWLKDLGKISLLCWSVQAIAIGLWFFTKLRKETGFRESDLMKLDHYSTVGILALTLIWVIYDISTFKVGFAVIIGLFMIIQCMIKTISIERKEKEEAVKEAEERITEVEEVFKTSQAVLSEKAMEVAEELGMPPFDKTKEKEVIKVEEPKKADDKRIDIKNDPSPTKNS